MRLRSGGASRASEPEGDERDLVRDTQDYLDARAHGRTHSARLNAAWERFYRLAAPLIRGGVRARGLSGADRDDCEQEIWTEVVAQLGQSRYDPARGGLRTWLSALARHKAMDVIRRRTRHPLESLDDGALMALPGRDPDPATEYEHHREEALVRRGLAELSRQVSECSYRVLLLRSIEERAVPEVAAALGLTPEQVRLRHCRVKRDLRQLVETQHERDAGESGRSLSN